MLSGGIARTGVRVVQVRITRLNTYIPYVQSTLMYKNSLEQSLMCYSFIAEASVLPQHRSDYVHVAFATC